MMNALLGIDISSAELPETRPRAIGKTKKTRVLHLITSFEVGGTERQAVELLKRIDRRRFDVSLAALRLEGPLYEEVAAIFPRVPQFPLTNFYNANAAKQLIRLREWMVMNQAEILHAHDFYAGLLGAAAARFAGVRVIACQRHMRLSDRRAHEHDVEVAYEKGLPQLQIKTTRLIIGETNRVAIEVANPGMRPLNARLYLIAARGIKTEQSNLTIALKPREMKNFSFDLPLGLKAVDGDQVRLRAVVIGGAMSISPSTRKSSVPPLLGSGKRWGASADCWRARARTSNSSRTVCVCDSFEASAPGAVEIARKVRASMGL